LYFDGFTQLLESSTKTATGLRVKAGLNLHRDTFHGEWNYKLCPETIA
jgi:hypothetical protein